MIQAILNQGFGALSAWTFQAFAILLLVWILAHIVNAITGQSRFDLAATHRLLRTCLGFSLAFAVLDYFLI